MKGKWRGEKRRRDDRKKRFMSEREMSEETKALISTTNKRDSVPFFLEYLKTKYS